MSRSPTRPESTARRALVPVLLMTLAVAVPAQPKSWWIDPFRQTGCASWKRKVANWSRCPPTRVPQTSWRPHLAGSPRSRSKPPRTGFTSSPSKARPSGLPHPSTVPDHGSPSIPTGAPLRPCCRASASNWAQPGTRRCLGPGRRNRRYGIRVAGLRHPGSAGGSPSRRRRRAGAGTPRPADAAVRLRGPRSNGDEARTFLNAPTRGAGRICHGTS